MQENKKCPSWGLGERCNKRLEYYGGDDDWFAMCPDGHQWVECRCEADCCEGWKRRTILREEETQRA